MAIISLSAAPTFNAYMFTHFRRWDMDQQNFRELQ